MFLMKKDDVKAELEKINEFLGKCLWMDFEFCKMNSSQVIIAGTIDQSYSEYAIDIKFEQPYFISSLFVWSVDTSKPFIKLASEKEEVELIAKYNIEEGNYIFKINVEDREDSPIFIAAKKIICNILNENPFNNN